MGGPYFLVNSFSNLVHPSELSHSSCTVQSIYIYQIFGVGAKNVFWSTLKLASGVFGGGGGEGVEKEKC